MSSSFGTTLVPRLERAIDELSQDLDHRADARQRRKLIALFRSTISECLDSDTTPNAGWKR